MLDNTKDLLKETYGFKENTFELYERALKDCEEQFKMYDEIREFNQMKVLKAFQDERISDSHFTNSSGYGYDDMGRDSLDIGISGDENIGSLKEYGVNYGQVDLTDEGKFDLEGIKKALEDSSVRIVHIQRSTGYGWRNSFSVKEIGEVISYIKGIRNDINVFVDNCYGEFIDVIEPTEVGADIIAGSLIKNIGGGIAPAGGYIVGKKELVEQAAYRLTVPGIGGECGATFGLMRTLFQGLFLAPHIAMEAVKGAVFCARIMELAGFEVKPRFDEKRSDIIQAIKFGEQNKLIRFCKGIQYGSPIDSFVECEPWAMPGYKDEVIMAAGAFIQGSSIELSADAPIREPYIAYLQGGLTFDHGKIGVLIALNNVLNN